MTPDDIRESLVARLRSTLEEDCRVLAAWLAGSDSNGRTDRWSDIDLVAIVEDDAVEATIDRCRAALAGRHPIDLELRLPMPTWHGHDQVFWQLEGVPDWCMVDFVVTKRNATAPRFLEVERHGTAQILFDREGLVRPEPFDRPAHQAKVRERLAAMAPRFRLLQHLVRKAAWRRDPLEAADRYLTFTLRPLVELLRIRHAPDRFDFGLRYLGDDLPSDAWGEIQPLALPGSLDAVLECQAKAEAIFWRELPLAVQQHAASAR